MHAPQITMIVLYALGIARGLYKHGEPDTPINAFASILGVAISAAILTWGGFFQ